uniref:Uncharacterized protein n=1 Tax=Oryza sativa subsp. japonica TaxID=39947 RepID=Q5Z7A7_ORYSJ|nr:hypothetical protein [Oryza sativa Japonica Group]
MDKRYFSSNSNPGSSSPLLALGSGGRGHGLQLEEANGNSGGRVSEAAVHLRGGSDGSIHPAINKRISFDLMVVEHERHRNGGAVENAYHAALAAETGNTEGEREHLGAPHRQGISDIIAVDAELRRRGGAVQGQGILRAVTGFPDSTGDDAGHQPDKIRKRTEDTDVALHLGVFQGIDFHREHALANPLLPDIALLRTRTERTLSI